jgi:hypothetical protein
MRKAVVVVAILLVLFLSVGAVLILLNYDNVTVSGRAFVSGAVVIAPNIQKIEFTDTQTGTTTTFQVPFTRQTIGDGGNYSVTLKNGHTYNVYLSFSYMGSGNIEKEFITTFTVNAPAGQTAITKNFGYPYFA